MADLIREVGPCRYAADYKVSPFGALASSIVYQQISGHAATAILRRLVEFCGGRLDPAAIRGASTEALRSVGLSPQKIGYLRDLAQRDGGEFDRRRLAHLSDERVIEVLTRVKGVGQWTAEMFLMFRLGRLDVLPVSDLGIQKAMAWAYRKRGLPSPAWMRRKAEPWRPYRTVACWYLWESVDGGALKKPRRPAKAGARKGR